jgi:predicted DNA-binding transcriptional regulator AlpA
VQAADLAAEGLPLWLPLKLGVMTIKIEIEPSPEIWRIIGLLQDIATRACSPVVQVTPPVPARMPELGSPSLAGGLLGEHEVAKRLAVSVATVRRWRSFRQGPVFVKLGSAVRYRLEDLVDWIERLPRDGGGQ